MARHLLPENPLAVCLNFHTCVGKRLRLNGGENAHLFPVVSEFRAAIKAHYISPRLHRGFTAALSPFAGLGETDAFVPASEQSVKNSHNLLPAVALFLEHGSTATHKQLSAHPGHIPARARHTRYLGYYLIVLVTPASFHPFFFGI